MCNPVLSPGRKMLDLLEDDLQVRLEMLNSGCFLAVFKYNLQLNLQLYISTLMPYLYRTQDPFFYIYRIRS